jgi:hypothetical protein
MKLESSLIFNYPQVLGGVGYSQLPKPNDELVPVSSVESQGYFHNLGHTSGCHSNLLGDKEYGLAKLYYLESNREIQKIYKLGFTLDSTPLFTIGVRIIDFTDMVTYLLQHFVILLLLSVLSVFFLLHCSL